MALFKRFLVDFILRALEEPICDYLHIWLMVNFCFDPAMTSFLLRTARCFTQGAYKSAPRISRSLVTSNHAPVLPFQSRSRHQITLCSLWIQWSSIRSFSSTPTPHLSPKRQKKYKLKTNHAAAARWKALSNRMYKRVCLYLFLKSF
jgi:hypothetical protein